VQRYHDHAALSALHMTSPTEESLPSVSSSLGSVVSAAERKMDRLCSRTDCVQSRNALVKYFIVQVARMRARRWVNWSPSETWRRRSEWLNVCAVPTVHNDRPTQSALCDGMMIEVKARQEMADADSLFVYG